MNKLLALILATLALSTHAESYVDFGVADVKFNSHRYMTTRTALGYSFGDYAIEGMVMTPALMTATIDTATHNISTIPAIYFKKTVGNWYGKVGVSNSSVTEHPIIGYREHPKNGKTPKYTEVLYGPYDTTTGSSVLYGIGYQYKLNDRVSLNLDYMMYSTKTKTQGIGYSVQMAL